MTRRPPGFWQIKANRIDAIKAMVEKSGKGAGEITKRDFKACGLDCLLEDYYSNDPALAVREAFEDLKEGGEKMRKSIKVKAKLSKPAPVVEPDPKTSSQQCCEPICGPGTCK